MTERLRVGIQLFAYDLGKLGNYTERADWFYLDYRLKDWLGVRAGRTSATVRFGRRALVIENGITSDAVAVIEGEVEPLLELATGSIVRELGTIRLRGH